MKNRFKVYEGFLGYEIMDTKSNITVFSDIATEEKAKEFCASLNKWGAEIEKLEDSEYSKAYNQGYSIGFAECSEQKDECEYMRGYKEGFADGYSKAMKN